MFSSFYEKSKKFISENYKSLLIFLITFIILIFPLPYYISTGGGTIDINDRVILENGYESKGSFNFAYVRELKATIPWYLISYLVPSWDRTPISDYKLNEEESTKDVTFRDKMYLKQANQAAIEVAYTKANKDFNIINNHFYIFYVTENATTDLEVGDELIEVDGKKIANINEYRDIVNLHNDGDIIKLLVLRDKKEVTCTIKVYKENETKLTGITVTNIYDYETNPKIKLKFNASESGPSGGLMLALTIYNKLIPTDLTHGKKIVGTGTISSDGTVGEIGGVSYKLKGAVSSKADIFLVPAGDNYEECIKLKKEKNYDIEIVSIKTFDDAVSYLEGL